jgi:flagellar biosynthesis protein FliP
MGRALVFKRTQFIWIIIILTLIPVTISAQVADNPVPDTRTDDSTPREVIDEVSETLFGEDNENFATTVVILLALAVLSLAPAIIMMMTSFIRIIVVLSFTRTALATQQMPPNQVLVGLALFLTFFIMFPTLQRVWDDAIEPYLNGEETSMEATIAKGTQPLRTFMLLQMETESSQQTLHAFIGMANLDQAPESIEDVPTYVIIPAYMVSELKRAFKIGVLIFIPFIIIDIVIASILLSMGLIFLPPVLISLPFKILLFVLVDGWDLLVEKLVKGFVLM